MFRFIKVHPIKCYEDMLNTISDFRIQAVHSSKRNLSVIAGREDMIQQTIPFTESYINGISRTATNIS